MRATTVMMLALGAGLLGRWANNKPVGASAVVPTLFVLLVVAMLDNGDTEAIAQGFAWLVLVAVLLGNASPLTGLLKIGAGSTSATSTAKVA